MRQYQIPTNFFSALQFTQVRKRHERRVTARARENEDHIHGPTHSRPNRPRSYLGIDLIVSCSLSLSLSRTGRWNRENCHRHGRPSTMTTSAKREKKKKTLRSPSVRPSLIETQKQKKTARALGPTSKRMDGGRKGGTRRSRTSCTAAPRYSARNAGGAHRGRGRAGARDHDGITAPRIRARASTSPGGATRAWGRAASPTSPSNRTRELVQQRLRVRPSARPFVHSRMQVIRANGGRRRQRRSKKKRRRRTDDDLEVATGGTPRHSLAPRLTTTSAAAHAPQRGDAIAIVVVAGHRWW